MMKVKHATLINQKYLMMTACELFDIINAAYNILGFFLSLAASYTVRNGLQYCLCK